MDGRRFLSFSKEAKPIAGSWDGPCGPEACLEGSHQATGEIVRDIDDSLEVGTEWPIEIQDEQRKPLRTIKVISEQH